MIVSDSDEAMKVDCMILAIFVVLISTMRVVLRGIEVEVWLELSIDCSFLVRLVVVVMVSLILVVEHLEQSNERDRVADGTGAGWAVVRIHSSL